MSVSISAANLSSAFVALDAVGRDCRQLGTDSAAQLVEPPVDTVGDLGRLRVVLHVRVRRGTVL